MKNIKKIALKELKEMQVYSWSVKDNSPRGCTTKSINDIKIGDKVVIDNYFTLVTN